MQSKEETAKQWLVLEVAMALIVLSQVISLASDVGHNGTHIVFVVAASVAGVGADTMRRRTNHAS